MPNEEWLHEVLQNSCQPAVKSRLDLGGLLEEAPTNIGVGPTQKPNKRKGAYGTPARRKRGRGRRYLRFR